MQGYSKFAVGNQLSRLAPKLLSRHWRMSERPILALSLARHTERAVRDLFAHEAEASVLAYKFKSLPQQRIEGFAYGTLFDTCTRKVCNGECSNVEQGLVTRTRLTCSLVEESGVLQYLGNPLKERNWFIR